MRPRRQHRKPSFGRKRRLVWLSLAIVTVLTWALSTASVSPAWGQLSLPSPIENSAPGLPAGVKRVGSIEIAPVELDNRQLFLVTAPAVQNRENAAGKILVEVRAEQIEANLQRVVAPDPTWTPDSTRDYVTLFDPKTLRVEIAKLNNQTILMAIDGYRAQPQELLTITELDARYYRLTIDELAQQWQAILQERLQLSLEARLPEVLAQQRRRAIYLGLAVIGLSLGLWLLQRLLTSRSRILRAKKTAEISQSKTSTAIPGTTSTSEAEPDSRATQHSQFVEGVHKQFTLERRLNLISLLRWLLFWTQILLWFGGALFILYIFPSTEPLAEQLTTIPIALLTIWFLIGFVNRLGDILINRFSQAWEQNELFTFEDAQRRSLRISTISRATKGLKTFLVYLVGLGAALSYLGVSVSSVLTLGAVVALAVSLASQSLIKDLVNGFLILTEDQYAIGDWIAVGTVDGLVENMNLRITQIRTADGRLITIPNSLISQVENLTRSWSRNDLRITVAYQTDPEFALSIVKQVAAEMYDDPQWRSKLTKPPQVIGLDDLSHAGMVIRTWIDTQPLQQWNAGREFRLRLRIAFAANDIEIGMPQQTVWHRQENHIDGQALTLSFEPLENGRNDHD